MSNTMELAFIANLPSNDLLTCWSPDGIGAWSNATNIGKYVGHLQYSGNAPSVAVFQGKFWMAFTSDNQASDILVCESSDGINWTDDRPVGQSTKAAPALARFGNSLCLAFIANDNSNELLITTSPDGTNWLPSNYDVHQSTKAAPAMTQFKGELWVAFVANNVNGDIIVCHTSDPSSWTNVSVPINQTSKFPPALAVYNDRLYLAFIANNDSQEIVYCSADEPSNSANWTNNQPLLPYHQYSKAAPSLTVKDNKLWLGFLANDVAGEILLCNSANGEDWTDNRPVGQTSRYAPSFMARELVSGKVRPLYQILTVMYAPPGTNGGKSMSFVDYGKGSTTGTTTSTTSSFKDGIDVSASAGLSIGSVKLGATGDFAASDTVSDSSSIEIKKATSTDIKAYGPAADGIDHDEDTFYLWLNPLMIVTIDALGNLDWVIGVDGNAMEITYVYAKWLKNPESYIANLQDLTDRGFTAEDFANILATNPFASGNSTIDPDRYQEQFVWPYRPPLNPNDPVHTTSMTVTSQVTGSTTHTSQIQYGVSVSVDASIAKPFTGDLKVTGTLQWTDTSATTATNIAAQTLTVAIGGPAYGYVGPMDVAIYLDTIFQTYMFAFPNKRPHATGKLIGANGEAAAYQGLSLVAGAEILRTVTDSVGEFRFYTGAGGQRRSLIRDGELEVVLGSDDPKDLAQATDKMRGTKDKGHSNRT